MHDPIIWAYPEKSCLVKELYKINPSMRLFKDLPDLIEERGKTLKKPDFIIDFSNPKEYKDNGVIKYQYSQNIKYLLGWHDALPSMEKSFIVIASTVGVKPRFIDLGDKNQVNYNIDRVNAERIFEGSESKGLILRIPMVACRDDSLLKRFKKDINIKIKNSSKKIPVMPPNVFAMSTIGFLKSYMIAKEIQMNIITIDYKSEEYTIKELQEKLSTGNILDYLIK